MSSIYGTVLSKEIDVDIKARTGNTYKGYRIVYRTDDGQIRPLEKTMTSLTFTPSVKAALEAIAVGDEITILQQKNDKGFLDVKAIEKGKFQGEAVPEDTKGVVQPGTTTPYRGSKVLGSTYETPEERKLKQRLIVRQAALNQALEFTTVGRSEPVDIEGLQQIAASFESWVYRGLE